MRRTDIEDRVRQMSWPEPSPDLRARVLAREPLTERPVTWTARVASDAGAQSPPSDVALDAPHARHSWRRSGVLAALSVLLMAGSCAGFDVLAGHRLEAEIARFETRYGSLDPGTLVVPAVPPADNRAAVVRAAAALAVELPDSTHRRLFDFRMPALVPPDLRAFAEANRNAIRLASGIRTRWRSNWEIDNGSGGEGPPVLGTLSNAIYLTALLDLEAGRADDATSMVVTGLGVVASLRQEPDGTHQWTRVNWLAPRHIEVIREILTRSAPSSRALEELAWWLVENRTPDLERMAVLSVLKRGNAVLARMENGDIDPGTAKILYPEAFQSWPSAWLGVAARIGRPFVRQARLRSLQRAEQVLDLLAGPRPHPPMPDLEAGARWALVDRLSYKFVDSLNFQATFADDFFSELGAAEIAVALRRYKLDRGEYPDDPAVLVPSYLASLPIDPYTGRPPVYARQGTGFTLRATGKDPQRTLEWNVPK